MRLACPTPEISDQPKETLAGGTTPAAQSELLTSPIGENQTVIKVVLKLQKRTGLSDQPVL